MGQPAASIFPPDAMEKVEAKGTDHYADMTDEERAEEDLPPRITPEKADAAPGNKAPEEEAPAGDEEVEEEPAAADNKATLRLFEEIEGLKEQLTKLEPAAAENETTDPLLEHDDPAVRALAQRVVDAEKRLATQETQAKAERDARQEAKDTADFEAVQTAYLIGGKPMTDAQVAAVEDWMLANPTVGAHLSIEQCTRVVYPDAVKKAPEAPPAGGARARANAKGSPVATIIDEGSAGGAPAGPWKPRPNETVESAVQAFGRAAGWTR